MGVPFDPSILPRPSPIVIELILLALPMLHMLRYSCVETHVVAFAGVRHTRAYREMER